MFNNIIRRSKTLFTWGENNNGLGHKNTYKPTKIDGFDNMISKVSMGLNHSAFITKNNELFTFGKNKYGQLGINPNEGNFFEKPKLVSYFTDNNIKVVDVKVGKLHTVVLDDKGNVYTFGQGKRKIFFLIDLFFPQVCALGRKKCKVSEPVPKIVKIPSKIKNIETGLNHCLALDENNDVHVWGRGEYGVLGIGYNKLLYEPIINDLLKDMMTAYDSKILKLKTISSFSSILLENGEVLSFGINDCGQMGNDNYLGLDVFESVNIPTEMNKSKLNGEKIIDFEIGEKISIFKTDKNNYYWCGRRINLTPEKLDFNLQDEIKIMSCSSNGFGLVLNNNDIHFSGNFFQTKIGKEDLETGIYKLENKFTENEIVEIGGGLGNSYALIN